MGLVRSALLAASQNRWLRERAPRYWFVRRTVSRFMPGETAEDALAAAQQLQAEHGIAALFTELGENITDASEAALVTEHYLELLDQIRARDLTAEVSVKLTQLGVDLSSSKCYGNLKRIVQHAGEKITVWIDMEASPYVDITLELYRRARTEFPNVGVCLQAYLYRTARDIAALMPLGPTIRLVKGAYKESPNIAYRRKKEVDDNYFALARDLLAESGRRAGVRLGIATHDTDLIRRITDFAGKAGIGRDQCEFQMLYGIQRAELNRLAHEGYRARVLISYGHYWFPWFMRRLAERPANAWFVVRNLFRA
jgi:proline dehydrogenase